MALLFDTDVRRERGQSGCNWGQFRYPYRKRLEQAAGDVDVIAGRTPPPHTKTAGQQSKSRAGEVDPGFDPTVLAEMLRTLDRFVDDEIPIDADEVPTADRWCAAAESVAQPTARDDRDNDIEQRQGSRSLRY